MSIIKKGRYTLNIALGIGRRFLGINLTLNYCSLGLHKHNYISCTQDYKRYQIMQKKPSDIQRVTDTEFQNIRVYY